MNDLISRQAAIDAVLRAEALVRAYGYRYAADAVRELPPAQPEIIRCKDCEDYQTDWETDYPNEHYCATMDKMMPADGFCSSAERRADETD